MGSIVVFAGCISIAARMASFWKRNDTRKIDLYTEVKAEIEAEKRIKNFAGPIGCPNSRDSTTPVNVAPAARGW